MGFASSEKLDASNLLRSIFVQLMLAAFNPENTVMNWKGIQCRKKKL